MAVFNPSKEKKEFFVTNIIAWGQNNFANYPWRFTVNQWHALAAEIMLQRTNADQVVPVYNDFCIKFPSPEDYLLDERTEVFKTLGLNWRENSLKTLAEVLSVQSIPAEKKELLKLPGVGNYIAAAYRSLHLEKRDFIIDSNVVRLYGRVFGFSTNAETRRKKWFIEFADDLTPIKSFRAYNYALLDFTRTICKPKPFCEICDLKTHCNFYQTNENEG